MAYYNGSDYTNRFQEVVADTSASYYNDAVTAGYPEGQCTWYCYGRALQRGCDSKLGGLGNAGSWYSNAKNKGFSTGTTPKSKSIACASGHVCFVEQYKDGIVYYTGANDPNNTDGCVAKRPLSEFKNKYGGITGYIYLD